MTDEERGSERKANSGPALACAASRRDWRRLGVISGPSDLSPAALGFMRSSLSGERVVNLAYLWRALVRQPWRQGLLRSRMLRAAMTAAKPDNASNPRAF